MQILPLADGARDPVEQVQPAQLMRLDLREHLVEGIGEQAQFILAQSFGPNGIIPAVGDGLRGLGQREDGLRNLLLQNPGKQVSHQERNCEH